MKRYLIAGLLAWLPLAITVWLLLWAVGLIDAVFGAMVSALQALLPLALYDELEWLRQVPGLSIVLVGLGLLITGMFVTNVFGQWALRHWDGALARIPIVKSIYSSVKQVSDTLFSSSGQAFREAVLVQYPRHGAWTIAFVTGRPGGEVAAHLRGEHVSIYVPTTPNPTSGFFLMVPRAELLPLAMSVDEALKYVISMGVVAPAAPLPPPPTDAPRTVPAKRELAPGVTEQ